jgi:ATP-dependent DNA helicase RecG
MLDLAETIANLRRIGSDTPSIEVKSSAGGYPASLDKSLCALANLPGGGIVILGLDESTGFRVTNLANAADLAQTLAAHAREVFDPPLQVDITIREFESSDIVVATIREVDVAHKPSRFIRDNHSYMRFWDGDYRLSANEVSGFVANRTTPRFDEQAISGSVIGELDESLLNDFVRNVRAADRRMTRYDDAMLLRKMGVTSETGELTVAGLLALGEYPQERFPNLCIQAAFMPDATANATVRVRDAARFTGPIPAMLEAATEWAQLHSEHSIVDIGAGRVVDDYDLPPVALRELIANSLVHRDLAEWSLSVATEIRITREEFRVVNPGGLYGVPVERLGVVEVSSARNGRLLRICQYLSTSDGRAVEALATGLSKVFAATVGAGRTGPRFFDQGLTFTARLPRSRPVDLNQPDLTAVERSTFALLAEPASLETLAQSLGVSVESVRRTVNRLIAKNLVIRHGGRGVKNTTYARQ